MCSASSFDHKSNVKFSGCTNQILFYSENSSLFIVLKFIGGRNQIVLYSENSSVDFFFGLARGGGGGWGGGDVDYDPFISFPACMVGALHFGCYPQPLIFFYLLQLLF